MVSKIIRISVLMGVYNNASTVEESIQSILNQTYEDFEFIICDDGSTDNTLDIIQKYASKDTRIVILKNNKNRGLSYTLNRCLKLASGEYIARMDGDDQCDETRFQKQVDFLDKNPQYAFVSSCMKRFNESGYYQLGNHHVVVNPQKRDFLWGSPFSHPAVMIRHSAYQFVGGYRDIQRTQGVEDYDLWFRLYSAGFIGYNLEEALYSYYDGTDTAKRRTFTRRCNEVWVRFHGYRMLKIPPYMQICALKPLLLCLLPQKIYVFLRKRKYVKDQMASPNA